MPSMYAIEALLNALAEPRDQRRYADDERLYRPYVVPRIRRIDPPPPRTESSG